MGLKRPFDDEFPEPSFKHSRQGENGDRVSAFGGKVASASAPLKPNISGDFEKGFQKLQWCDIHVDETGSELSSAPFSWITTSFSEDHTKTVPTSHPSRSSEDFEFNFPRRAIVSFEDLYSSHPPRPTPATRKHVPIGPNHQAIVPLCGNDDNSYEERLMGTSIIPMPDSTSPSPLDENIGAGRRDCSCVDMGSIRCVRQHVMEAREKLRDTLGQEKFVGLGFYDMGEDLAKKWSEEEEHAFHEVVYSSPGRNFWKNLSLMFPSRSKGEIVSYYFNVFMLRRRAAQNRSKFLDVDSDDDEWHGTVGGDGYDDDDVLGSPEDVDEDEDDDSGNTDAGDVYYTPTEHSFDTRYNSCMSFECQGSNSGESCATVDDNKCKIEKASDGLNLIYMLDPCESKSWDIRYPSDPVKGVDLLPTCNMIEEIFGEGTWDDKKIDDL